MTSDDADAASALQCQRLTMPQAPILVNVMLKVRKRKPRPGGYA